VGEAILVTGGAGYIGSHTVQQLLARGESVVVLDNLSTGFRQAVPGAKLVEGDVGDQRLVTALLREHQVRTVIHFAAHTIVPESWVRESLTPDPIAGVVEIADGCVRRGRYQWFLTLDQRAYFAKGYRGQYIFVIPEKRAVFVRFGESYGDVAWPELFFELAQRL